MVSKSILVIVVLFIAGFVAFFYLSSVDAGRSDAPLAREDCVDLYRKYNCSETRISGKLCQDLNACIFSDDRQCVLVARNGKEDKIEQVKEDAENFVFTIAGALLGANTEKILKLRHSLKSHLTCVCALLWGLTTRLLSRKPKFTK